jgi:hypothetical protein
VKLIKERITETVKTNISDDKGHLWELIKLKIRNTTIPYCIRKNKMEKDYENKLEKRYEKLHSKISENNINENEIEEFECIKNELKKIEINKARGIILRSKCKWVAEGEINSAYFLGLEKRNYINKVIDKLQIDDTLINSEKEILKAEMEFYSNLYRNPIDQNEEIWNARAILMKDANLPMLSQTEKDKCNNELTEYEILTGLKELKNGKSPGTDGLTPEFYKFFWIDIKKYLLDSLVESVERGILTIEQRRGIITLIPKKDKNRLILKKLETNFIT